MDFLLSFAFNSVISVTYSLDTWGGCNCLFFCSFLTVNLRVLRDVAYLCHEVHNGQGASLLVFQFQSSVFCCRGPVDLEFAT